MRLLLLAPTAGRTDWEAPHPSGPHRGEAQSSRTRGHGCVRCERPSSPLGCRCPAPHQALPPQAGQKVLEPSVQTWIRQGSHGDGGGG